MTEMVKQQDTTRAGMLVRAFITMPSNRTDFSVHDVTREQLAIPETARKFPSRSGCAALPWATLAGALDDWQETVFVH